MAKLENYVLKQFLRDTKHYQPNLELAIWQFRYICYRFNFFMKHVPLPIIKKKCFYEAVFVDFRILPNIEFVIRNAILKLGNKWSFTVVCGKDNHDYINKIIDNIDRSIRVIRLEYNNISQQEYSNLLTTKEFWEMFYGEKILIYQEDSLMFHGNILPFLNYDFIGAPFGKNTNDTPNCVGNGGLSLRTKCKMLDVIRGHKLGEIILNSSTLNYMQFSGLKNAPEDVYFSKNMQDFAIGEVADWDTAFEFSSEQVFNPNSFGGHKYWISNSEWKSFTLNKFNHNRYLPKSNLNTYLLYKYKPLVFNKTKQIKNAFDVDLHFFCNVNNINHVNDKTTLEYMSYIGLDGFIYHPKQLFNI